MTEIVSGSAGQPSPAAGRRLTPLPLTCSLSQTLAVVGERWAFLIVREALIGATRFSEFRSSLEISTDVLTARLTMLVDGGVMTRRPYQGTGQRTRMAYELTASGRGLALVLGALQQWGDENLPSDLEAIRFRGDDTRPLTVRFVDDRGVVVEPERVKAFSGP